MDVTFESFQSFGTTHSVKDLLKIIEIGSESWEDNSRSSRGLILSGPDAPGFSFMILSSTIFGVMLTIFKGFPISGLNTCVGVGIDERSSRVKADTNWLLRI